MFWEDQCFCKSVRVTTCLLSNDGHFQQAPVSTVDYICLSPPFASTGYIAHLISRLGRISRTGMYLAVRLLSCFISPSTKRESGLKERIG